MRESRETILSRFFSSTFGLTDVSTQPTVTRTFNLERHRVDSLEAWIDRILSPRVPQSELKSQLESGRPISHESILEITKPIAKGRRMNVS